MPKFLHDNEEIFKGLNTLLKRDAVFKTLRKRGDLFLWKQNKGSYEDFVEMVISQQISVKAADAIFKKLKMALNNKITAAEFLKLKEKQLRNAGLSFQKIDYLTGLSEAVVEKRFQISKLKKMNDKDVIENITALKGFGLWSAQMYLIFSLARPDVWPFGDLGVQNGIKIYTGAAEKMKPKEVLEWGEKFKGKRTAAALLLWKLKDTQ